MVTRLPARGTYDQDEMFWKTELPPKSENTEDPKFNEVLRALNYVADDGQYVGPKYDAKEGWHWHAKLNKWYWFEHEHKRLMRWTPDRCPDDADIRFYPSHLALEAALFNVEAGRATARTSRRERTQRSTYNVRSFVPYKEGPRLYASGKS